MSKKLKITLSVISIFILIVAGILFMGYQYLFNNISNEEKAEIQNQIDEITQSILEQVAEEQAATVISDAVGNESNSESDGQDGENSNVASSDNSSKATGGGVTPRQQSIINSYYSAAKSLQSKGYGMVDSLVASAKSDYKALVERGASKSEIAAVASSYTSRAGAMESSMDSSVNSVLSSMKSDLIAAGMDAAVADRYVSSFRSEYEGIKASKRSAAMAAVTG